MNIDEYLKGLGFVERNGRFICVHSEPMLQGGQEVEFCIKELIANYEGVSTLLKIKESSN